MFCEVSGISDHSIVHTNFSAHTNLSRKPSRNIPQWKTINHEDFKAQVQDLNSKYFQRDPDSKPVDENWTWFRNTIKEIVSNTVLHKVLKGNIHKPWFTPKLKRLCSKKEKAYIKAKKSGKEEDWKIFTKIRKQVNNRTRTAHRHYKRIDILLETQRPSGDMYVQEGKTIPGYNHSKSTINY